MASPEPHQFPKIGSSLPAIPLRKADGTMVSLKDLLPQKLILFCFSQGGGGTCLKEILNMKEHYQSLSQAGYEVIGFSPEKPATLHRYMQKRELPFQLLSDEQHELLKALGAWGEKTLFGKTYMGVIRTTFLYDEKGKLTHLIYPVTSGSHAQQILTTIHS